MRRQLLRSFAVAAAIAAMSIPVFGVGAASHHASACSQPGGPTTVGVNQICFFNISPGGVVLDTYISPITGTFGTATFAEIPTSAETSTVSLATGSLSFEIYDLRGNNQGFTAYLSCTADPCLSNPYEAPYGIPASNIAVTGPTHGLEFPFYGVGVGRGFGVDNGAAVTLGTYDGYPYDGVEVGGACAAPTIGLAAYLYDVPLTLALDAGLGIPGGSHYNTLPVSFFGSFTVSVVEGAPGPFAGDYADASGTPVATTTGCPTYNPAASLPVAAAGGGPVVYPF